MKVLFFSSPWFVDCDVPLIGSLQKIMDITYIIDVSASTKNYSMLEISDIKKKTGIYPADAVIGLENVGRYLDLNKVFVLWHEKTGRLTLIYSRILLFLFLVKKKFDIIHITWPLNYTSFLLYLYRKRMILTVHDPIPHSNNLSLANRFYRQIAFKLIDNFIILNQTQRSEFIQSYGLKKKNVYSSHLSIYYHLQDVNPVVPDVNNYVLFFGQISSYKGLDVLCEAMRIVKKKIPNSMLIVAGRGDLYFNIGDYVNEGTIEFRNYYISDMELVGLIKNASFVVCPYVDATQSGVVMSSYSLNTPVVVTNTGGLPEMVEYGKYGPVVPARDVKALADIIVKLLSNGELLFDYRKKISQDYNSGDKAWSKIAEGILRIYDSIIKNSKK